MQRNKRMETIAPQLDDIVPQLCLVIRDFFNLLENFIAQSAVTKSNIDEEIRYLKFLVKSIETCNQATTTQAHYLEPQLEFRKKALGDLMNAFFAFSDAIKGNLSASLALLTAFNAIPKEEDPSYRYKSETCLRLHCQLKDNLRNVYNGSATLLTHFEDAVRVIVGTDNLRVAAPIIDDKEATRMLESFTQLLESFTQQVKPLAGLDITTGMVENIRGILDSIRHAAFENPAKDNRRLPSACNNGSAQDKQEGILKDHCIDQALVHASMGQPEQCMPGKKPEQWRVQKPSNAAPADMQKLQESINEIFLEIDLSKAPTIKETLTKLSSIELNPESQDKPPISTSVLIARFSTLACKRILIEKAMKACEDAADSLGINISHGCKTVIASGLRKLFKLCTAICEALRMLCEQCRDYIDRKNILIHLKRRTSKTLDKRTQCGQNDACSLLDNGAQNIADLQEYKRCLREWRNTKESIVLRVKTVAGIVLKDWEDAQRKVERMKEPLISAVGFLGNASASHSPNQSLNADTDQSPLSTFTTSMQAALGDLDTSISKQVSAPKANIELKSTQGNIGKTAIADETLPSLLSEVQILVTEIHTTIAGETAALRAMPLTGTYN